MAKAAAARALRGIGLLTGPWVCSIYTFPQTGIQHCIDAFLGLFTGQNRGKMTLKLVD